MAHDRPGEGPGNPVTMEKDDRNGGFRSGFVAIVGRPNVGKSTLLNALVGEKIAAVSPRPNTTRNRILGIRSVPGAQIVFFDTPGLQKHRGPLSRAMVREAMNALSEADLVLMVIDATDSIKPQDERIIRQLPEGSVLVINKIDRVKKPSLLTIMDRAGAFGAKFTDSVPVSALDGDGVEELIGVIVNALPEGGMYYEEGMITDQPERFIAAEFIREKIFLLTKEEIPYKVAVVIEEFNEEPDRNLVEIVAGIYVERQGHKGILIGKGGAMLKQIGTLARGDIERILNTRVYLELRVKVKEKWSMREGLIREYVYDP